MTTITGADQPVFAQSLREFKSKLSPAEQMTFQLTTFEDLQKTILEIQERHASVRKIRNLNRLKSFLEAMKQYGDIIEVFLNTSEFVAFVWGPAKFLLHTASNFVEAFEELLAIYQDIGESLPMFAQYENLFKEKDYMRTALGYIYKDLCSFHQQAYAYFKKSVWRQLFQACWKTFRTRFNPVVEDIRRHKRLIETQASLSHFEEIQRSSTLMEEEFRNIRDAEDLRRLRETSEWLAAADMTETQELKSSSRAEYPQVCQWILREGIFQKWFDLNSDEHHLIWINGIPGAGEYSRRRPPSWTRP
jgi:hypothetical protein